MSRFDVHVRLRCKDSSNSSRTCGGVGGVDNCLTWRTGHVTDSRAAQSAILQEKDPGSGDFRPRITPAVAAGYRSCFENKYDSLCVSHSFVRWLATPERSLGLHPP